MRMLPQSAPHNARIRYRRPTTNDIIPLAWARCGCSLLPPTDKAELFAYACGECACVNLAVKSFHFALLPRADAMWCKINRKNQIDKNKIHACVVLCEREQRAVER